MLTTLILNNNEIVPEILLENAVSKGYGLRTQAEYPWIIPKYRDAAGSN